ncbi:MAG: hypothetical protein JJT78_13970 [Leptospira sp.]|nr:hypothetical protein [Leptospira sp.]
MYLFSFLFVKIPDYYSLILFFSILIIYNVDHLLDSFKLDESNISNPRRYFHIQHRSILILAIFILIPFVVSLSWIYLDREEFYWGTATLVLIGLYLGGNYLFPLFPKEFLVASIYTIGVSFVPFFRTMNQSSGKSVAILPILGLVFLIAFLNLLVNSYLDLRDDFKEKSFSFFQNLGDRNLSFFIQFLACLGILSLAILNLFDYFPGVLHTIFYFSALMIPVSLTISEISQFSPIVFLSKYFRFMGEILFFQFIFLS